MRLWYIRTGTLGGNNWNFSFDVYTTKVPYGVRLL